MPKFLLFVWFFVAACAVFAAPRKKMNPEYAALPTYLFVVHEPNCLAFKDFHAAYRYAAGEKQLRKQAIKLPVGARVRINDIEGKLCVIAYPKVNSLEKNQRMFVPKSQFFKKMKPQKHFGQSDWIGEIVKVKMGCVLFDLPISAADNYALLLSGSEEAFAQESARAVSAKMAVLVHSGESVRIVELTPMRLVSNSSLCLARVSAADGRTGWVSVLMLDMGIEGRLFF